MKTPVLALLSAALLVNCSFTVQAQFGGLKDAARKAKDAMKKKDAEAQAQKDPEARRRLKQRRLKPKRRLRRRRKPRQKTVSSQEGAFFGAPAGAAAAPSFQVYSKFDFVPGEKIVAFEDFSQDAIGDFPQNGIRTGLGKSSRFQASLGGG